MIQSMTGFGRALGPVQGREVTVEVKSVNNRFRDIVVRLPKNLASLEETIKKTVADRVNRGRVDLWVQVDETMARRQSLTLDLDLARAYHDLFRQLTSELGLAEEPTLAHFVGLKDLIRYAEEGLDDAAFLAELRQILAEALDKLTVMRQSEGQALNADFQNRLTTMAGWVDDIWRRRDMAMTEAHNRLEARIKTLLGEMDLDPARLHQEAVFLVDRADVTEELVRLRSHFDQFREALAGGGPAGRRLEFLLQEMGREVNTIGSKSTDGAITSRVLDLKTELERLREQALNVE